jgi:hypothetical protein
MLCQIWKHSIFGFHPFSAVQNRRRNNFRGYDIVPEQSPRFERFQARLPFRRILPTMRKYKSKFSTKYKEGGYSYI